MSGMDDNTKRPDTQQLDDRLVILLPRDVKMRFRLMALDQRRDMSSIARELIEDYTGRRN